MIVKSDDRLVDDDDNTLARLRLGLGAIEGGRWRHLDCGG
jgi:hypothetical protein